MGHTTTIRRDAFGRVIEVTDPLGHRTRVGWTTEGRPTWREQADGARESWTWDGEGNLLVHTDPAGNTTHQTSTRFDRTASRTDPDGARFAFTYDTELRLTAVINPRGLTWSYRYDEAGRLVEETDFNGRTLTYAHDAAASLASRTNGAGETLRLERDARGRVVAQLSDSNEVTTYAYGPDGRLSHAANADVEVVLERDALGRILAETADGRTIRFAYDALGRRTRRVTPSGLASEWAYDPAGHPVELRSEAGSLAFGYDPAGRETERWIGEGVTLTQAWGPTGRLTVQSLSSATAPAGADRLLQHRAYAYRADGYLTEIRELTSGTRRFDLDSTGRVTGVRAHGWTETYAYDVVGNLVRAAAPGHDSPGEREFEGSLIRRAGRATYEHDGQGRRVRKTVGLLNGQTRTWTYAWTAEDRLSEVVTPDGECWRYAYDALGRRISKHRVAGDGSVGERTEFSWDDARLAEQTGPDGTATTWEYAPGSHRPVTQTSHRPVVRSPGTSLLSHLAETTAVGRGTRFRAIVTDGVGTPTELVTPQGEVVWQLRTTLWGTPFPSPVDGSTENCPLGFPGQYLDPETDLRYNFFRYYDPETAQYVSPDPLGLAAAPHPFAYVSHPLSGMDPLGLYDCTKVTKVIDQSVERASGGRRRTASGYHGHLSADRELEILSNPDGVYISQGGAERLIFHQGEDIVVMESKGGARGNVITSYGPSGPKNDSGAAAWGGSPEDPGPAVTREMIIEGKIPTPKGGTLPPATPLR